MFRSILCASLLASLPSAAFDAVLPSASGLQLPGLAVTSCAQADVCVAGKRLEARHGIRRNTALSGFAASLPILLEEPYSVRDASGAEYRLRVLGEVHGMLWIELLGSSHPLPANASAASAGRFSVSQVRIGGEDTDARYPPIELRADGTFQLGRTSGHWFAERGQVLLTGHFSSWGPAQLSADSRTLTFRFRRETLDFEMTFSRLEPSAELVAR